MFILLMNCKRTYVQRKTAMTRTSCHTYQLARQLTSQLTLLGLFGLWFAVQSASLPASPVWLAGCLASLAAVLLCAVCVSRPILIYVMQ